MNSYRLCGVNNDDIYYKCTHLPRCVQIVYDYFADGHAILFNVNMQRADNIAFVTNVYCELL